MAKHLRLLPRPFEKSWSMRKSVAGLKIEWTFNIERAPWWGGMFQRIVRSTKRCLRKVVGRTTLSYEELLTIVTEVEMIVNSRPISYVSSNDLEEPLTPSHLLIGRRLLSLPDNLCYYKEADLDYETETTTEILTRRMRFLNSMLDRFWKRWKNEYLLELRNSHRLNKRVPGSKQISSGEVVVVHNDNKRRGFWNLGVVEEIILGRDRQVRGATVRVSTGLKNRSYRTNNNIY